MSISAGDAVWTITGDTSPLEGSLRAGEGAVGASTKRVGLSMTQVGMGITAIGAGITGFLGVGVHEMALAENASLQLDAVLQSTGGAAGMTKDAVLALSNELQTLSTFGDDAITAGQSLLLTFTNIGKDVFPAATMTMLDMSQALGQDLKSSAVQLGKALNDPIAGITALSRVGVTFSDQQKAMIEALVTSGDLMGAQKLILAELAKEFGGSATAAAQGFAGQLAQTKNSMSDLMQEVGGALVGPEFKGFVTSIGDVVRATTEWIKANPETAASLVKIAAAIGGVSLVLGPLILMLPVLSAAFVTAMAIITSPITGFVVAIGAVVLAISYYWDEIKAIFLAGFEFVSAIFTAIIDGFKSIFGMQSQIEGPTFGFPMPPGRAAGGPVTANRPYIVGEQGPELFVPHASGSIVPNGTATGGTSITINMGGVAVRSDADIRNLSESIAAQIGREMRGMGAFA
jgi:phage-related minor tail protein